MTDFSPHLSVVHFKGCQQKLEMEFAVVTNTIEVLCCLRYTLRLCTQGIEHLLL
jgi:hypothetical protein